MVLLPGSGLRTPVMLGPGRLGDCLGGGLSGSPGGGVDFGVGFAGVFVGAEVVGFEGGGACAGAFARAAWTRGTTVEREAGFKEFV